MRSSIGGSYMGKTTWLVFAIIIQVSTAASAFHLYQTPNGTSVRWDAAEVEIVLDPSLEAVGDMNRVEAVIQAAFARWEFDAGLPVQFVLVRGECHERADDENNCIFACTDSEDSCAREERDNGAGAFLSVNAETGVIRDVDIVLNAVHRHWDADGHCNESLNLGTVMTHEIGHLLGIDHSDDPDARMYATMSEEADDNAALHNDDISAAETLYEKFSPSTEEIESCSTVTPGRSLGSGMWMLLLVGLLIMRRVRKEIR